MPRISDEQEIQVITRYTNSESARTLAADLGCSVPSIYGIIARHGLHTRGSGGRRLLTAEQEQKIVAALRAGISGREIAVEYNVSASLISNIRKRHGAVSERTVYARPTRRKLTPDQEANTVRRYVAGESSIEIAQDFSCAPLVIRDALKRNGVSLRPSKGARTTLDRHGKLGNKRVISADKEDVIIKRYLAGETARTIARAFFTDKKTITTTLRRNGVEPRPPGARAVFTKEQTADRSRRQRETPKARLRKLLISARYNATLRGLTFDDELLAVYAAATAPTHCACCEIALDYSLRSLRGNGKSRSPSFDRVNNEIGYTVHNVVVVCARCNRLKSDSTLAELKMLVVYVERHSDITPKSSEPGHVRTRTAT